MNQVIIGVDPHKLSATIEVVDHDEQLLGSGRFTTDKAGLRSHAGLRQDLVAGYDAPGDAIEPCQRLGCVPPVAVTCIDRCHEHLGGQVGSVLRACHPPCYEPLHCLDVLAVERLQGVRVATNLDVSIG